MAALFAVQKEKKRKKKQSAFINVWPRDVSFVWLPMVVIHFFSHKLLKPKTLRIRHIGTIRKAPSVQKCLRLRSCVVGVCHRRRKPYSWRSIPDRHHSSVGVAQRPSCPMARRVGSRDSLRSQGSPHLAPRRGATDGAFTIEDSGPPLYYQRRQKRRKMRPKAS